MVYRLTKIRWLWSTLTFSLLLLVFATFYCIYQVYVSNKYWKEQFTIADSQYEVQFKQQKIILTDQMKQWIAQNNAREQNYYRAVIKGYGTHLQLLSGNGLGTPSVKHFFVKESQISIQGNILKIPQGMFCGNWQLIHITPEQYIFYLYKRNNN